MEEWKHDEQKDEQGRWDLKINLCTCKQVFCDSHNLKTDGHTGINIRIIFIFNSFSYGCQQNTSEPSSGPCNSTGTGYFQRLPKATQQYVTPHTAGALGGAVCVSRAQKDSFVFISDVCLRRSHADTPSLLSFTEEWRPRWKQKWWKWQNYFSVKRRRGSEDLWFTPKN